MSIAVTQQILRKDAEEKAVEVLTKKYAEKLKQQIKGMSNEEVEDICDEESIFYNYMIVEKPELDQIFWD